MAYASIALAALPVIGLVLWLVKTIMKLSFSVIKILGVLLVAWFVFAALSGSLGQAIDGIGKPAIEQDGSAYSYIGAISDGELDLSGESSRVIDVEVNSTVSRIKIKLPEDCVAMVNFKGACVSTDILGEKKFIAASTGKDAIVVGSGTNLVQIELNAAFCDFVIY